MARIAITRSENMRRIKRRDTKPEKLLRSLLHRQGFRYRIDLRTLPGRPDIVFTKKKVAVLVHGCFWHRHVGCKQASEPKTNRDYWGPKLQRNVERDLVNEKALSAMGYRVAKFWECEIEKDPEGVAAAIKSALMSAM